MAHYRAEGRAHRMLQRLAEGPARTLELKIVAHPEEGSRRRNKCWHTVAQLRADLLIDRIGAAFAITQAGIDALACLNGGHPFSSGAPGVRYFQRAA